MLIVTVVGARPQFVKASPVSRALLSVGMPELIVHTGQHYDAGMSATFFSEMQIPEPAVNLGVGSGPHGWQTAEMLKGIEGVLHEHKPDWVLVYGDTNSTIAAALAAAKLHIPIAHVEAGLRSFNRLMPEEINRIVTDVLSSLLFAPNTGAYETLKNEGITESSIVVSGDVMYDAALRFSEQAERTSTILELAGVASRPYALATIHRAENTDDLARLATICDALERVSRTLPVVLPLHPRTRSRLDDMGRLGSLSRALRVIDPVGYLDMITLEKAASVVVTDSGGVQKEAFFFRVPCVTIRGETEWVELVEMGWNRLCRADDAEELAAVIRGAIGSSGVEGEPYGDGRAADKIVAALRDR